MQKLLRRIIEKAFFSCWNGTKIKLLPKSALGVLDLTCQSFKSEHMIFSSDNTITPGLFADNVMFDRATANA